jgi:hypothetical protein
MNLITSLTDFTDQYTIFNNMNNKELTIKVLHLEDIVVKGECTEELFNTYIKEIENHFDDNYYFAFKDEDDINVKYVINILEEHSRSTIFFRDYLYAISNPSQKYIAQYFQGNGLFML